MYCALFGPLYILCTKELPQLYIEEPNILSGSIMQFIVRTGDWSKHRNYWFIKYCCASNTVVAFFSLNFCNWIVMHGMENVKLFSMSNRSHNVHCLSWFQSSLSVPLWLICGGSKECLGMCQVALFCHQTESNFYFMTFTKQNS
jgi:hypothetical protein